MGGSVGSILYLQVFARKTQTRFGLTVTHAMRAAVPLKMRAAALTRPRTARASPRCAARATTRAPAAVTPRPAAASTVAFDSASPASRGASPSGAASAAAPSRTRRATTGRGSTATAAGAAAAAAASTATSVPEVACAVSLGYMAAAFVAYYLGARDPTRFARCARFTASPASLAPPCVAYLLLLVASWSPDTLSLMMPGSLEAGLSAGGFNPQFFPSLGGISTLLSRRAVAASAWMHLACVNLFVARHAATKAAKGGHALAHTLVLSFVFGPAGLFSHFYTAACATRRGGEKARNTSSYGERYGRAYGYAYGGGPADAPSRRSRATKHKFALMSSLF